MRISAKKTDGGISAILLGAALWSLTTAFTLYGTSSLIGCDAFYHVEISKLMLDRGLVIREFPWTTCSIWSDPFFDKEWLFHVCLAPFLAAFGKFDGARIAVVCFVFAAGTSWGLLLRALGVKRVFFGLLLILFCVGYAFPARLVLCRSLLFSITLLPLAIACVVRKKKVALAFVSLIYMLSYVGAWQIVPIAFLFDAARRLRPLLDDHTHSDAISARRNRLAALIAKLFGQPLKLMAPWAAAGIAAGLVLSPYFPNDIKAIWLQSVQVLAAKWFGAGGGGNVIQANELNPIGRRHILTYLPLLATFAVLLWHFFKKVGWRVPRPETLAMLTLVSLYLGFTIMSQRFVEYLAPLFGVAATLFWSEHPSTLWQSRRLFSNSTYYDDKTTGSFRLCAVTLILIVWGILATIALAKSVRKDHMLFEDSAKWIAANVKPGSLIFSAGWGENCPLFYHLPQYRFLVMLEPYFMYAKSPRKYMLWLKIAEGKAWDAPKLVISEFKTNVVFVPKQNRRLKFSLLSNDSSELVFEGKSGESVFTIEK